MGVVLWLLSILAVLFGVFWGGMFGVSVVGGGIILALLALSVEQREQHDELLKALGYERPSRREEFEAARRELESDE